jgi:hypothetical protein
VAVAEILEAARLGQVLIAQPLSIPVHPAVSQFDFLGQNSPPSAHFSQQLHSEIQIRELHYPF